MAKRGRLDESWFSSQSSRGGFVETLGKKSKTTPKKLESKSDKRDLFAPTSQAIGKPKVSFLLQPSNSSKKGCSQRSLRRRRTIHFDVNRTDERKTALLYAVQERNNDSVIRALIADGADVNTTDDEGKTALFYAVQERDNESVVRALVDAGADVNIPDNEGKTVLFYAVQIRNNERMFRALVNCGADVNIPDNEGKTVLFYAVQERDNDSVVCALVIDLEMNVTAKDIFGRTPLLYAVTKSLELASVLIEKGANLHCKDNCDVSILSFFIGNCILNKYDGCLTHMKDTLTFFMENGVKRKTIFKTIISVVFCQILRVLMEYNMFRNREQAAETLESLYEVLKSAKDYAKKKKKRKITDLIDEILQQTRNKTIDRLWSVTPNILELLIKLGANPTSADSEGNTAIHFLTQLSVVSSVSQETVHDILTKLEASEKLGNFRKLENHQQETPFVHMIYVTLNDRSAYNSDHCPLPNIATVYSVCKFLLQHGSSIEETSRTGRTAFHWILRLISQVLLRSDGLEREKALTTLMQMFELFTSQNITEGVTVNQKDAGDNLNTPLHLLASLQLTPGEDYSSSVADGFTFKSILDKIVRFLLKSGAQSRSRNKDDETPLHLCRTWCAFIILSEIIKNQCNNFLHGLKDKDSLQRRPLLTAAKNKTFLHERNDRFFPDCLLEPKMFFQTVIEKQLDVWAVDKDGDSVMSVLIKHKSFVLAEALVEAVIEKNQLSTTAAVSIMNAISREITAKDWKKATDIAKNVLMPIKKYLNLLEAFTFCCKNSKEILLETDHEVVANQQNSKRRANVGHELNEHEEPPRKKIKRDDGRSDANFAGKSYVHSMIAKMIVSHSTKHGPEGVIQSFQKVVEEQCPRLQNVIFTETTKPETLPWQPANRRYRHFLEKVARKEQHVDIKNFSYHPSFLGNGSFSSHKMYVGIGINDGREVAVKQCLLEATRQKLETDEILKETQKLITLQDCPQIINYFTTDEKDHNCKYLVMELMEGDIDYYLDSNISGIKVSNERNITLIHDFLKGVDYMHSNHIIHCNLNPRSLLIRLRSDCRELCLKIAGFQLSRYYPETSYQPNCPGPECMKTFLAPELLREFSSLKDFSKKSDMFSCLLMVFYILDKKAHPYCPNRYASKNCERTIANITRGKKVRTIDGSVCSEAKHMVKKMTQHDIERRPSAEILLKHPLFWDNEKKTAFLKAVANEKEFSTPHYNSRVVNELERRYSKIVAREKWNDSVHFNEISTIYKKLSKHRRNYDVRKVADLVRLFRNACEHFHSSKIKMDVFFVYFPNLLIEVYDVVTSYNWHHDREKIKNML